MRVISAKEVEAALDFESLVERLRDMFRVGCEVPSRHHHTIPVAAEPDAALLLMPAWQENRHIGVKLVTVFPGNTKKSLPSIMGVYLLLDGCTGKPLALIDGPMLTLRRTAAASALAASYLARPDSERLLMVGTGALAPHLVLAHATTRPIKDVVIWGRHPGKAGQLAERLNRPGLRVTHSTRLEEVIHRVDIISCATLATCPLVRGEWLRPGQHIDLVGGFTTDMREADDEVVRRARIFVDSRAGATKEAGDIVQPIRNGVISENDIVADLFDLTRGLQAGRRANSEITLFKSVGTALEDLAAAQLVTERV